MITRRDVNTSRVEIICFMKYVHTPHHFFPLQEDTCSLWYHMLRKTANIPIKAAKCSSRRYRWWEGSALDTNESATAAVFLSPGPSKKVIQEGRYRGYSHRSIIRGKKGLDRALESLALLGSSHFVDHDALDSGAGSKAA